MTEKAEAKAVNPEFAKELVKSGASTLMLCFQCGTCTSGCPSGKQTAFRVRKVVRKAQLGMKDDILPSDELWLCSTCYTCYERCPRGVEVVDIIMALRNLAVREGYMAEVHKNIVKSLIKNGCSIPLTENIKSTRKKLGLDEVPRTVLAYKNALGDLKKIITRTGLNKLIGEVE